MDRIGRYKIVRELGRGAMGVVYHAIDPNIGRPVAIKTIRVGDSHKPGEQERMRERLLREARSAGMLSHPGIVTIYDVEQQDDLAYIAMEYVDGPTLEQLLSHDRALSAEQISRILRQTAAALDYAHQRGIVHRDIKPANIMIAADAAAKITDFGIAKISTTDQFTMTGTIVGTPHYMSPEQVQGQAVDGRSDQFSLAVIAYEMLTGEKPYTGDHLTTVVYKIVAEDPVAPHRLNPTIAGGIENALRKGLSKKPENRYRTCQEFTEALEKACLANRGWKPLVRGGSLNAATIADESRPVILPPARNPRPEETLERKPQRKANFTAYLMAILGATGLLAAVAWVAGPQLSDVAKRQNPVATSAPTSARPPSASKPQGQPLPGTISRTRPGPAGEAKPSPMPPAATTETAKTQGTGTVPVGPVQEPEKRAPLHISAIVQPQALTVLTSPSGATAILDARQETACTTPCSIEALPGRHNVAITMAGYQIEHQEVDIGAGPKELQIVLQAPTGTLLLQSDPAGASISVNGEKIPQVTPAQIPLAPGTYKITLEKNGKQGSGSVDVTNGFNYMKIPLQ
ncbi:MAG: protein kinase [Acidobacteriia bacterium]|nr:protein kinase [Terriglobia bacterium]